MLSKGGSVVAGPVYFFLCVISAISANEGRNSQFKLEKADDDNFAGHPTWNNFALLLNNIAWKRNKQAVGAPRRKANFCRSNSSIASLHIAHDGALENFVWRMSISVSICCPYPTWASFNLRHSIRHVFNLPFLFADAVVKRASGNYMFRTRKSGNYMFRTRYGH